MSFALKRILKYTY